MVHLQEDGCIYRYGMLCFTFISISSLVGRRVCSVDIIVCSVGLIVCSVGISVCCVCKRVCSVGRRVCSVGRSVCSVGIIVFCR